MPLLDGDRLIGVLDVDSPKLERFTPADARLLEALARTMVAASDWRLAGIDGF